MSNDYVFVYGPPGLNHKDIQALNGYMIKGNNEQLINIAIMALDEIERRIKK